MNHADLTDDEVDQITAGLRQNAAKIRFLQSMGLTVRRKPNGRPLVNREHYNRKDSRTGHLSPAESEPNWGVRA